MISAEEARKMTETAIKNGVKNEVERIEREMDEAIKEGHNSISLDGTISRPTVEYLRKLGYEVNTGSQYNESYFTINW